MAKDYSHRNLRKESFRGEDLVNARFYKSDLRGVDFTGANLTGASFAEVKTGIDPSAVVVIFLGALLLSILSGYVAMLAGRAVQTMLSSEIDHIKIIGIVTMVVILIFIIYSYQKGGLIAIRQFMVPLFFLSIIIGAIVYFFGAGTGEGLLLELAALLLVVIMFVVGTIARITAGTLSNLIFIVVALSGGLASKSLGGSVGTLVMAVSCALISKRALSGADGFETVRKISNYFTSKFGTSFRNSRMNNADFSECKTIRNADFSNTDISSVSWGKSHKANCIL
jgi:hypothetical protein